MKAEIKKILFSRNNCTVAAIQDLLAEKVIDTRELSAVLGDDIAGNLCNLSTHGVAASIQPGGIYEDYDSGNLIVLWGARSSGKSSVIASLLTLEGMTPVLPKGRDNNSQDIASRIQSMTGMFSREDGYQRLLSMDSPLVETYHARYRKGMRNYPLTFVECGIENWIHVNELLAANSRQIHLFCIDCRQDIDAQVADHKRVTELLIRAGYLQQASGVYVLVTKADLMNVPELYWDNAVQTLVTTSMASGFWRLIRNKCKEAYIYNEQPVACSVGDFVLKDYAQLKHDHTRRLCEEYILPKCEHNHWGLFKLLKLGSKKMAVAIAMLALVLLGVAGYFVLNAIDTPPTRTLLPYDYSADFSADVRNSLASGTPYASASDNYTRLRIDLEAEHGIRLKDKTPLLPDSVYNRCDKKLCNAFAEIMKTKMQVFFENGNWSSDTEFINKALSQLRELNNHRHNLNKENASDCQQYRDYLVCYTDTIKKVIDMAYDCTSLSDVKYVVGAAERCADRYPYSNDIPLNDELSDAAYGAYSSCTNLFVSQGNDLISSYSNWKNFSWFDRDRVAELASSMKKLRDEAESLLEHMREHDKDSQYEDIISKLNTLIEDLNNAFD